MVVLEWGSIGGEGRKSVDVFRGHARGEKLRQDRVLEEGGIRCRDWERGMASGGIRLDVRALGAMGG